MIIAVLLMVMFIIPVFTGLVVNIGNVTGFLLGFLLYQLVRNPSLLNNPWIIGLLILISFCTVIAAVITHQMIAVLKKKPAGDETLIILGCEIMGEKPSLMQVERLEAALKYLKKYPDTCAVCSGGKGKNEKVSEAYAMKKWLCEHGIDEKRIYMEDASTTTLENIRFSKVIMEQNHLNMKAAVCTNEFHLYRAVCMAQSEGLSCSALSARTAWWLLPTFYVRELYAVVFHRLRGQLN